MNTIINNNLKLKKMYTVEAKDLKKELFEMVNLLEDYMEKNNYVDGMSNYEVFQIALGMQKNKLFAEANVLGTGYPSALERISMVLEEKQ